MSFLCLVFYIGVLQLRYSPLGDLIQSCDFYIVLIGGWFTNLCIRQDLCSELQRHILYPLSFAV